MGRVKISLTEELGRQIRKRRKQLGLTQEALAERLGVGHQALSRIEQGKMAPKMERLPALAACLQCAIADLFRFEKAGEENYAERINDLLSQLPEQKKEFVYNHLASLIRLLNQDE